MQFENGGAEGIRTPGLLNAIETRSQLRYSPRTNRSIIHAVSGNVNISYVRTDGVPNTPAYQKARKEDVAPQQNDVASTIARHDCK